MAKLSPDLFLRQALALADFRPSLSDGVAALALTKSELCLVRRYPLVHSEQNRRPSFAR